MSIKLEKKYLKGFISQADRDEYSSKIQQVHDALESKTGKGSDFLGWMDLPSRIEDDFIKEVNDLGESVRKDSDCIVSIGIGGSYLGIRAAVEFLRGKTKIPIYYAGHNMSAEYMSELLKKIEDKRVTLVVISKSGTTTEPAIAFRILKQELKKRYSDEELKKRIICVTDSKKGALRQAADKMEYSTFVIPDDVGGRFSVLTPVGLVPLALAGIDI